MDGRSTRGNDTGRIAEDAALAHLRRHGLTLVQRNFRCKAGEIDLVMRDRHTLVFVEVKHRSNVRFGDPLETIDRRKQLRLARAAEVFLQRNRASTAMQCRFDVVASRAGADGKVEIVWLPNAFSLHYS